MKQRCELNMLLWSRHTVAAAFVTLAVWPSGCAEPPSPGLAAESAAVAATATAAVSASAPAPPSAVATATSRSKTEDKPASHGASVAAPPEDSRKPSEASDVAPSHKDFVAAKGIRVTGAVALGCEVKFLRGWLRVSCRDTKAGGKPISLAVTGGKVEGKTVVTVHENKILQLVTPVADGTKLEADFAWSDKKSTLIVDRTGGVPDSSVSGGFSGFRAFPLPKQFHNVGKEVVVNGAVELGCTSHTLNGWVKLQCGTLSKTAGKPKAITVTQGKEDGATQVWVIDNKMMTLITPFAIGSEIEASFDWSEAGTKTLSLVWPKGESMPFRIGGFDGFPDIPVRKEFAGKPMVNIERGLAHSCTSRMTRGWLRVACNETNATGGKPKSIKLIKGAKDDERRIEAAGGSMSLTVKVVAGTDLEALFTWTDASLRLRVLWPEDKPQPDPLGRFNEAK